MVRFGILTLEKYAHAGEVSSAAPRASYRLLDVGEHPSEEQIRVFEEISFALRTSNGTFRTTFRKRFQDVDAAAQRWMEKSFSADAELAIQDRAVSHGLTSWEWAERVFRGFPRARFEASDILLELIELSRGGEAYIVEPNGQPIQYVRAPFVVSLQHPEPRRYPVNHVVAAWAGKRFKSLPLDARWMETAQVSGWSVRKIPYLHPHARQFNRVNPNFRFQLRSVFDITPESCDVLRTMNIFNRAYFTDLELRQGAEAAFQSLRPGGIWVLGRTLEEDFTNHASLLRRGRDGWEVLERVGRGADMEELALAGSSVA